MRTVILDQKEKKVVEISDFDARKIYASKYDDSVYKLQCVEGYWTFCFMNNSNGGSQGVFNTAEETLKKEVENLNEIPVFEFKTLKEFAEWILKETPDD